MHCPSCFAPESKVIDSRLHANGSKVRRRRSCQMCEYRFSTYETIERYMPRVIKSDGTLWSWGYNRWGQLGLNESSAPSFTKHRSSPTQLPGTTWSKVSRTFSNQFGIKTDGTLWVMGKNDYGQMGQGDDINRSSPTQITGTWKNIVSGGTPGSSVLGVKTDGTLWVWGNASNQGAMGNNTRNIDYSSPVQLPGNWSDVGAINGYGLTAFRGV